MQVFWLAFCMQYLSSVVVPKLLMKTVWVSLLALNFSNDIKYLWVRTARTVILRVTFRITGTSCVAKMSTKHYFRITPIDAFTINLNIGQILNLQFFFPKEAKKQSPQSWPHSTCIAIRSLVGNNIAIERLGRLTLPLAHSHISREASMACYIHALVTILNHSILYCF